MQQRTLIIALDFTTLQEVKAFLQQFGSKSLFVKVGMELFYKEGPEVIHFLKSKGHQVFLDLKLHDIPTTVMLGMKSIASLGVDLVNVHAAGGRRMMEAALEGLEAGTPFGSERAKLIAVTQLTSTSEEMLHHELLIPLSLEESVKSYATLTRLAGLDGVVCSVWEVPMIREVCGEQFLTITPGIRNQDDAANDQTRIATPLQANQAGSSMIVVGRSITKAMNPVEKYESMKIQWGG
ncbi:orotidine-5'-phosphate decarboxylase [Bacillus sp. BGMRC 2118]|nr:orotidine-5'-phosphate decarboxylase [Bacillus sp. BGMRC 2118]